MKRILGLLLFILSVPCFAADNIKMVTYFPVPYLAYNELGVVGTCDLGLMGTCGLNAGKYLSVRPNAGVAQSGLNRGVLALKGSELDLQSTALAPHVQSYVLRVGDQPTSKAQEALLTFRHRLEVGSLQGDLQSIEADNTAYMDSLTLFGSTFPTCTLNNHKIGWKRLTFDQHESTFLVCGEGEADCTDKYGKWTTVLDSTLTPLDTCNGNSSSAFTCSGTATTCRDVVTTTESGSSFYRPTYGASSKLDSMITDTCDGDTTNKYTPSCTGRSSCVDVYTDYSGVETCRCGGVVDDQGNHSNILTCFECDKAPSYGFGGISGVASFCNKNPGLSCCNNGTPVRCPNIYKRTITCTQKDLSFSTTKYRTVTCCGSSSTPSKPSDPVTKKLVWTKVANSGSFGVKCPGGNGDPIFYPTGATMASAPSGTCSTEGEKRYIILGLGGAGAEYLADPYSYCQAQTIGTATQVAQGATYECKAQ